MSRKVSASRHILTRGSNLTEPTKSLPCWPSGGNRRKLDELWLSELEQRGLQALLPEPPGEAPQDLYKASEEFNAGAFWECHETLEDVWRGTPYPLRFFYHAVIKTAVGFHHLGRHNRHGARTKLSDGVRVLQLFQPEFMGLWTDRLLDDASRWLSLVEGRDPVDWPKLDALPRPLISRTSEPDSGRRGPG